jgi:hypothetical protein
MLMPRMQRLRSVQQMQLGMHWQHVDRKTEWHVVLCSAMQSIFGAEIGARSSSSVLWRVLGGNAFVVLGGNAAAG